VSCLLRKDSRNRTLRLLPLRALRKDEISGARRALASVEGIFPRLKRLKYALEDRERNCLPLLPSDVFLS
jgi:hypothetical protein